MTALSPTVLREDAIVFRNDNFHINDDDCQRAADALDLLADLLDLLIRAGNGLLAEWKRHLYNREHGITTTDRIDARMAALAAVLEAHR